MIYGDFTSEILLESYTGGELSLRKHPSAGSRVDVGKAGRAGRPQAGGLRDGTGPIVGPRAGSPCAGAPGTATRGRASSTVTGRRPGATDRRTSGTRRGPSGPPPTYTRQ